jgi:chloramphenicol-sensitive protein RarD
VTLVPLVCFNAARAFALHHLGFLQYLAPTLVLLQAVLLFGEHLSSSTLLAFIFIWAGLAVYSVDAWVSLRRRS